MKIFTTVSKTLSPQTDNIDAPLINKKPLVALKFRFAVSLLMIMVLGSLTSSAQLLTWNTFGNAGTETTEPSVSNNANIAAANLTQGTITAAGNGNRFGGSGWFNTGNTVAGNTLAEAVAGNDYIQFIVTPNGGFSFTPTSFVFNWDRSGTGPSSVTLRSSVDGFAGNLGTVTGIVAGAFATNTITISGLTNITTATTFRLYGYGATGTGGTGGFDIGSNVVNVTLNGTTAAAMQNQTISGLPATDTRTYTAALQQYNLTATASSGLTVTYASSVPGVASIIGNTVTINGAGVTTITASQAGNGSYNPAPDVTQTLTVNKATQTIVFGGLVNRNDVDPNFQLTATGGSSGNPIVYTSSLTSVAEIVNSGGTIDPAGNWVDIIAPGQTTITASQAGNSNYFAATPVQQVQTILNTNLINQAITGLPATDSRTYGDADYLLTASGGGSGNPVTYSSDNPAVATIVGANGDMVHIVGPGTATISANQAGNAFYNAAPTVTQLLTVNQKTLTVSNATVDTKPYDGTTAATISGATLNGVVSPDIVSIAGFAGTFADPNVAAGIPVTAGLTLGGADAVKYILTQPAGLTGEIIKANQTITFNALADKSPGDANFNYTATTTSGLPISYTSSVPSVATIISGSLVHIGVVGASTITASQAGNSNYNAAISVQQTQNVVPAVPASIFANLINDATPYLSNPFTSGQTFNSNIAVSGVGRGTGITGTAAANRYAASGWNVGGLDPTKYFEFTLTPNSGYRIDFSSFVYTGQASGTGPTTFAFRSSVDSYTANIGTATAGGTTISLAGGIYQNITSAITFRVYGWGASAAGGTFSINDFVFNGNVFAALPTATFVKTNVSVCGGTNDGTIIITPGGTGPFTYSWTGETGSNHTPFTAGNVSSLTGLQIGYYNVTVTDANLNTITINGIHVEYAFSVYITNNGSASSGCGNTGSIILYGNSGVLPYTYSLDGTNYQAGNTFINLAAGPYTAYVKDGAGCVSTKSITVAAAAAIVVNPFVRPASSCSNDGSIEIYKTGGIAPFTYSIDGTNYQASNKFLNLAAGPYTAYAKDSKGCVGSQPVTITQGTGLSITFNKTNSSTCVNDGTIQLNATGGTAPYTYSLDGTNYQASNSFGNLAANTYTGWVKDFKGCTGSQNITISLNTINVTAYATPSSTCISNNGSIQLFRTGGTGPYTYSLDGNTYQASGIFNNLAPDYYTGYVKDSKTCIGFLIDILVGPESCLGKPATAGRSINAAPVEISSVLKVSVYPNPTSSEFVLNLEGYTNDKVAIMVTDIMGRKIYQAEGNGKQQYRFGNNFKTGLYNVQVIQGTGKKSITLVKD